MALGVAGIAAASAARVAADVGYVLPAWAQWLGVVAAVVAALGIIAIFLGWLRRPWRRVTQTLRRLRPIADLTDEVQAVVVSPNDPSRNPVASFRTNRREGRVVTTNPSLKVIPSPTPLLAVPTRLDFKSPCSQTIRSVDLPADVPGGRGDMTVRKFIPGGFVIDEGRCINDRVEVHLFFD
jgi:hypothetical protein